MHWCKYLAKINLNCEDVFIIEVRELRISVFFSAFDTVTISVIQFWSQSCFLILTQNPCKAHLQN